MNSVEIVKEMAAENKQLSIENEQRKILSMLESEGEKAAIDYLRQQLKK